MSRDTVADFIEVHDGALPRATCAAIVERVRASAALQPGRVGGGVFPELKRSRDLSLAGRPEWSDCNSSRCGQAQGG